MDKALTLILSGLVSLAVLALTPPAAVAQAQPQSLRWVGCTLSRNAYVQELATAFEADTGVRIFVDHGDATVGIREVANLTADIGGSCRFSIEGEAQEAAA
ncbi:MAG: hypothetical protein OEN20_06890, partial [Gammaproteobacteria bacterium]|nr:hypothetical protein [Gammaproteobacteria bacterium]